MILEYLALVEWAKVEVETFAELFRSQVYSSDLDQEVIEEAIIATHTQSKKVHNTVFCQFRTHYKLILVSGRVWHRFPLSTRRSSRGKTPN